MKPSNIKRLTECFVGKVCTILTTTVCKTNFQDQQFSDFFTGFIESIDEDGIFAKHHITGCKNFYNWNYVVSILEEQVITEDDPQYQEIIKEVKKAPAGNQSTILPVNPKSNFVDADFMANLAKQAKGKMLQKGQ